MSICELNSHNFFSIIIFFSSHCFNVAKEDFTIFLAHLVGKIPQLVVLPNEISRVVESQSLHAFVKLSLMKNQPGIDKMIEVDLTNKNIKTYKAFSPVNLQKISPTSAGK